MSFGMAKATACVLIWVFALGTIPSALTDDPQITGHCHADESNLIYHHAEMFGEGISKEVPVNTTTCFMISPRNSEDSRIDRHCEPPSTGWVVQVGSTDGRIFTRAPLLHLPHEGFHMACYLVPEPATYKISIFITSLNHAKSLHARNLSSTQFPFKLVKEVEVVAKAVNPAAYARKKMVYEASLPFCSPETRMQWRGGEGRWIDNQWYPYNCQLKRISPDNARKCLAGKRLLFAGDTQQLAAYSTALAFLSTEDHCTFVRDLVGSSKLPKIRCDKMRMNGQTLFKPDNHGKMKVGVHRTEFDNGVTITYYGTAVNGFAVGRIPPPSNGSESKDEVVFGYRRRRMLREGLASGYRNSKAARRSGLGRQGGNDAKSSWVLDARPNVADGILLSKERTDAVLADLASQQKGAIMAVFVAHTRASDPLNREWMIDPKRRGPLVYEFAPFDHVLATSGVHDVFVFDSVKAYEKALDEEYVPSLRLTVNSDLSESVTWMGSWSISQQHLSPDKVSSSNAGRTMEFDRATERVAREWSIPFLDMEPITQSRPDLALGPAHYSWHVARAVMELWLGPICPDMESQPDTAC